MSNENMRDLRQNIDKPQAPKRGRRVWLIAIVAAFVATAICILAVAGLLWDRRSADERLAEIEAARAIPDSENAATIYSELLHDPNATSLLDDLPESESVKERVFGWRRHSPWLSKDYPELAAWIIEHQFIIERLTRILSVDKCRFPISIDAMDTNVGERARAMRHWGYLLTVAASNDVAEGRTDAAMVKWQCLLQMAHHLQQQPEGIDHLMAEHNGQLALLSLARFIVEANPGKEHLRKIEAMPIPIADNSTRYGEEIRRIDDLEIRKELASYGLVDRVRYYLWRHDPFRNIKRSSAESLRDLYLRYLTTCRETRILVALRRFEGTTGQWPRSLDEIRSSLPDEVLTDPSNKGPFVYQPAGDTFRLYSRGKNNIDENGKWESDAWESGGCDDWLIWPPSGRTQEPERQEQDMK